MCVTPRKWIILLQRKQRAITSFLYIIALTFSLYAVYDPSSALQFILPDKLSSKMQKDEKDHRFPENKEAFPSFFKFTTTPRTIPSLRMIDLPFIPKDTHNCEDLFYKAKRNFSYADFYLEHMDAFKSALSVAGIMSESNVNEQSWAFHEMAKMDFVTNVCETGFYAGHNTFQWLSAKPDLSVYSFESRKYNWSDDMASFMSAEFPDHFHFYQGDTIKKIRKFRKENNKTMCDIVFVDAQGDKNTILMEVEEFRKIANPVQNIFILDLHGRSSDSIGQDVWNILNKNGHVVEHFKCFFMISEDILSTRSHNISGFYIGSFVS